jgi:replicative DNA helicase
MAFPFLKTEYFMNNDEQKLFGIISEHIEKYKNSPSREVLHIMLNERDNLTEEAYKNIFGLIDELKLTEDDNIQWLTDTTEKFCQEKALYNALMESVHIVDGEDKAQDKGEIPKILTDALSVSFDPSIGHDYFEDSEERFDYYHQKESKIEFDLEMLNKITKGGLSRKSLNIILAGTGVGKSLFMCHCSAGNLSAGNNVLYITLEMAEEKIAERIDANLLDVSMEDLSGLSKEKYLEKVERVRSKTIGKLVVKEYPTAIAHTGHFRHLINELSLKKKFIPDIIYVDYLNICSSSRLKSGIANSYTYVKSIAEELRGLAVEYNVPVVSATQTTRSGYGNSDVELTDTSESFGLPATADLMFALISSDELEELDQVMIKQLKNRYNDLIINKKFVLGIDRAKMRLYDAENSAQDLILEKDDSVGLKTPMKSGWSV